MHPDNVVDLQEASSCIQTWGGKTKIGETTNNNNKKEIFLQKPL